MMRRSLLGNLVLTLVVAAALTECRPGHDLETPGRPRLSGGPVHGSVYYAAPAIGDSLKLNRLIVLPDIEVYLHNLSTGTDGTPVTTDLQGRYYFPFHQPGSYELRWKAQRGWAAGKHSEPVNIASGAFFPVPARIQPERGTGVVHGQVTLGDGDSPWSYDELFGVNHTATVTILNAARTATLAGPLRTNVEGSYAAAGLPRGQPLTIRVQSEASQITRALPASSVSIGNPVSPTDIQLANSRPEIISVVPKMAGALVQTAAAGETISLEVATRDVDGDALTRQWIVVQGNGTITPSGAGASWTLPNALGRHSAYLQVGDQRGGYARQRIDFITGRSEEAFSGRAVDKSSGAPVTGANVSVNGNTTVTDGNGFFRVKTPLANRYVLSIVREGFALFSRVVDSGMTGQTWLLVRAQEQTVDPTQPIVLVDQRWELDRKGIRGVQIRVPADALVSPDGLRPAGMLKSYIATLDIADGEAPGDWGAIRDGVETNLISYGALFVEFRDGAGTSFNLAPGQEAEVQMFAPPSMVAGAPPAASLWSYDETEGYWKESSSASFSTATQSFTGKVSHFSTINTDIAKDDAACLKVLIYPPIPTGVKLRVSDPTGTAFTQTFEFVLDAGINGVYRLPANSDVRLELLDADGTDYDGTVLLEETPGVSLTGNIVNTGAAIPSGQSLWPPEPYESCKLVILREANAPTANAFLNFKGAGTLAQATGYYQAVDPNGERLTLGDWWTKNGFVFGPDGIPTNAVRTAYLNYNDLGSGRDMYFKQNPDGTAAAYVTNYGLFNQDHANADLAANRDTPGATVAMEFSPVEGQGVTRIVKFFVYAGNDFAANAVRQEGANLDDFGVKFVPNLCLNCHGGSYSPADPAAPSFAEVNMGSSFRELDIATYKFPGGRLVANATEKAAFRDQNLIVRGLNLIDAISIQPIKDLISGWYPSASTEQDNDGYTPPGWTGTPQQGLYHDVVKRSCRTCHVALDASTANSGIGWITYDQLELRQSFLSYFVLCQGRFMPHAVTTYRNFWLSTLPHQPASLRNFNNGSGWPALGSCP